MVTVTVTAYLFLAIFVDCETKAGEALQCAIYAFYAWWVYFPQSGALAEGTSRPLSHTVTVAHGHGHGVFILATSFNNWIQ